MKFSPYKLIIHVSCRQNSWSMVQGFTLNKSVIMGWGTLMSELLIRCHIITRKRS